MIKVTPLDKGALKIECALVVSDQQREKLHTKQAHNMLKDMNIEHAWVATNGDQTESVISAMSTSAVDDTFFHELEMKHIQYLSEVDKIELDKKPTKTAQNNNATFVKELLEECTGVLGVESFVFRKGDPIRVTMTAELWTDLLKTYLHANSFK